MLIYITKLYKSGQISESNPLKYLFSYNTNRELILKAKVTNRFFLLLSNLKEAYNIELRDKIYLKNNIIALLG